MVQPRSVRDIPSTPHFSFLYGAFSLSKWRIPYFISTMTLEEASNNLNLTAEMPGAENIRWHVDELYQRDIDWVRVENQIVPYLFDQDKAQFFNSLTIALLPFYSSEVSLGQSFNEDNEWTAPPLAAEEQRFARTLPVGPIKFGFWEDWASTDDQGFQRGEFIWNTKEVFGVAIDGQHRLAAIKSYMGELGGRPEARTRIPVIFLVFDPRVGYEPAEDRSVIGVLRELFIDLNKHAQTVSRARQILLDDRDPQAVCLRRLIGNELSGSLEDLGYAPPRLPLGLVDWHREQAKFDDGPYVTTVLGLDWIVSQAINTRPIKDFTDYSAVETQLARLGRSLGLELDEAKARLRQISEFELMPFAYKERELDDIKDAFADRWSLPLCHILTEFYPYREFISLRERVGAMELEFQHWYRLYERSKGDSQEGRAKREYRSFVSSLKTRKDHPISEEALKDRLQSLVDFKGSSLAFKVVFQRALVQAFLEYTSVRDREIEELREVVEEDVSFPDFGEIDLDEADDRDLGEGLEGDSEEEGGAPGLEFPGGSSEGLTRSHLGRRADEFVRALNEAVTAWPGFLLLDAACESAAGDRGLFWSGTLRKAEGDIDFTQGASVRAKDLIVAVALVWLYQRSTGRQAPEEFDDFWADCQWESGPRACERLWRALMRFSRVSGQANKTAAERILEGREMVVNEDAALEEAVTRLRTLWLVLGSG